MLRVTGSWLSTNLWNSLSLERDKHSSLFVQNINNDEKKVLWHRLAPDGLAGSFGMFVGLQNLILDGLELVKAQVLEVLGDDDEVSGDVSSGAAALGAFENFDGNPLQLGDDLVSRLENLFTSSSLKVWPKKLEVSLVNPNNLVLSSALFYGRLLALPSDIRLG